ncbi:MULTISPECIES: hypothetical protein [unclassified Acinetobacter]|uniref:hypothetical protein n=1 Tax=unclassified Acinetobacter TaxID=196816 RepID=UPI00190A541D|nr:MULTISPECIES: hypothetical protein [unclassified Acinetobacter]MBK0062591.1 hypothetical protein [Acinetobacter sp. S55]MBK0065832.1 hypothetical protein [Acinetobacter sp. S54]
MQNDSNLESLPAEIHLHPYVYQRYNHLSNAVLTPHLNHPNFQQRSDYSSRCNYSHTKRKFNPVIKPISDIEKIYRKKWAERQVHYILNMPSNAVLEI